MKTRFTSLVKLKKSAMDKSELVVQKANKNLYNATTSLEDSYNSLQDINPPDGGKMNDFLASRTLFASAREQIVHNQNWVSYAKNQLNQSKDILKSDMIEYEKFKYLELQEIQKEIKRVKIQEMKDLDEIALMTYAIKEKH